MDSILLVRHVQLRTKLSVRRCGISLATPATRSSVLTLQPGPAKRQGAAAQSKRPVQRKPTVESTDTAQAQSLVFFSDEDSQAEARASSEELLLLVRLLPTALCSKLETHPELSRLVEVVMDLGRPPAARWPEREELLSSQPITAQDLEYAVQQVGSFDKDNRAGIDATLHRISAMRNRAGRVVGLTCRVGRAIPGSAALVEDLALAGRSILLLGRPGVGKTTAIRELSRMLADACRKRAVIVDTSNEIGGDGDIPHPGIGGARRMQVPQPEFQHRVMIEAVENHMPQVIIIDEIGTAEECIAARTIAQRGVQLVATAHGNELENVIKNPSLADLVGGIQSVTLGDDEARRRGVQKSILERAGPPTFDVCVEMLERGRWRVHADVATAVDLILVGREASGEERRLDSGSVKRANFRGTLRSVGNDGKMTQHEVWEDVDKDPAAAADSYLPSPGFRILPHQAQGATVQGSSTSTARLASGSSSALSNRSSARQAYSAPVHTASQMDTSSADAASLMPYPPVGSGSKRSEPVSWGKDGLTTTTSSSSGSTRSSDSRSTQECRRSWPQRGSETKGYAGDGSISLTASILDESEEDEVELLAAARAASAANKALRAARDDAAEPPAAASLVAGREGPDDLGQNEEGRTRGMRMFLLMDSESADQTWSVLGALGEQAVIRVPSMDTADVIVATRSRLRNTPKMRIAARKAGIPIYAVRATSTSALLRDLCPLLGLDSLAVANAMGVAEAKRASSSATDDDDSDDDGLYYKAGSDGSVDGFLEDANGHMGSSVDSSDEESTLLGISDPALRSNAISTTAGSSASTSPGTSRLERVLEGAGVSRWDVRSRKPAAGRNGSANGDAIPVSSAADDYAELLESTVRELRYGPVERQYATHILERFMEELEAHQLAAQAALAQKVANAIEAKPEASTTTTAAGLQEVAEVQTYGSCANLSAARPGSVAVMVWGLSFVKHKKKFVQANPGLLGLLARACDERLPAMRPHEMVRVAEGWANLRAPLPAAPWLDRLTLHGQAAASSGALPQADVLRLQRALEALQAQDMLAAGGK